jgi:ABC transport system ATP-binding/permease protein
MRTEASALPASPLTVSVASTTYVFSPGPDVIVGSGSQCHIRLDRPGEDQATSEELVLRFADNHWVAIDRSHDGVYVDGVRVSVVDIHDGQAIAIGDPQQGPRLVFHVGSPVDAPAEPAQDPPPPVESSGTGPHPTGPQHPVPTARTTGRMRVPRLEPVTESPTGPLQLPSLPPSDQPPADPGPFGDRTDPTGIPIPVPSEPGPPETDSTFRLPLKADARTYGVTAHQLGLTTGPRQHVLTGVSFAARPGTLTAVVGPSAVRNSALLELLSGVREPSAGQVSVDGHDVHVEHESMRTRMGIVPRDERVHTRLTVVRALTYAARLRLPTDTSPEHRDRVVDQVLDELELTAYRKTRIRKLPPEVRRCIAMAIELVSRPTLLVVDEPSAGLDAAQAYHVLAMLRRQADIGCVVVVTISAQSWPTSLNHLNMCDELLLLTAAGTTAFAGPPAQIESAMATGDWSQILARLSSDPEGAHHAFLTRQQVPAPTPPVAAATPPPARLALVKQIRFVVGRQLRLLFSRPFYLLFLILLAAALAALTLLIPGDAGFGRPGPSSHNPHEAVELLAVLNIAAVIIGTVLTVGELVGERRIFRREQVVGLSPSAYLLGKIIVFGVAAAILATVLTAIVVAVKGAPTHGAVLLGNPNVELAAAVAATAVVSAIVGLALSTVGNSLREVLPLVLPVVLASLLFAGGLVTLVGTWGYDQVSWFIPAQWGFAATAATVDLHRVDALAADAQMWTHYSGWWVFDMGILLLFGALWAGFVRYRLRLPRRETPRPVTTSRTPGTA